MCKYLVTLVSSNEFSVVCQPILSKILELYCNICIYNFYAVEQAWEAKQLNELPKVYCWIMTDKQTLAKMRYGIS